MTVINDSATVSGATPHDVPSDGMLAGTTTARRGFLRTLGIGAGAVALAETGGSAFAQAAPPAADVFNFALNFEYLGAELYLRATTGQGLSDADTTGTGTRGEVTGGRVVPFSDPMVLGLARELAEDEVGHARFLRSILGGARIARPRIDFAQSFTVFARSAGLVPSNGTFDAFANDQNFLLAAFILEDVCVTAIKGATPLIRNNEFLEGAAGLLASEGYHGGVIRAMLAGRGLFTQAQQISDLRNFFDGPANTDRGIGTAQNPDLFPEDVNSLPFSRTPQQVLAIAYGSGNATPGGFFPNGTNGAIR